jgi:hypothetical protein
MGVNLVPRLGETAIGFKKLPMRKPRLPRFATAIVEKISEKEET